MATILKSAGKFIKNFIVNLSLVFISLLFCFILLEIGFRLAGYQAIYDTYSKSSLLWKYDSLLGWSHIPKSEATYTGPRPWPIEFTTPIQINSDGLRGPEIGNKEGLRILVLGDSIVTGFEVDYNETFTAQLQKMLSKRLNKPVQVINAGVRGYGSDQSYLYYKDHGKDIQADFVLFLHASNDPLNNITLHRIRRPFGKPAFQIVTKDNQQQIKLTAYPTPKYTLCSEYRLDKSFQLEKIDTTLNRMVCQIQMSFADYSAFFTYVAFKIRQNPHLLKKLYYAGNPQKSSEHHPKKQEKVKSPSLEVNHVENTTRTKVTAQRDLTPPDRLTSLIIKQLSETVKENDAHFILLASADMMAAQQVDQQFLRQQNIDIINIDPMRKAGEHVHLYDFQNDSHWNKAGHKKFAQLLVPDLIKRISSK